MGRVWKECEEKEGDDGWNDADDHDDEAKIGSL